MKDFIAEQLARRRADSAFMERLDRRMQLDKRLMERLGGKGETVRGRVVTGKRSPTWCIWSWTEIPCEKGLYLKRLRILGTPWFGVSLHWIHEADTDYDPHDHPWNFTSVILRGGYTEKIYLDPENKRRDFFYRRWKQFSWHSMPMTSAHQITSLEGDKPTVSLIFMGKRRASWGFWKTSVANGNDPTYYRGVKVDWKDYG